MATYSTTEKRWNGSTSTWDVVYPITLGQNIYGSGTNASTPLLDNNDQINSVFLPTATASAYGAVKAAAVRTSSITTTTGGTTSSRYYGVELDSTGKMFVNVPWSNTTTYLSYTPSSTTSKAYLIGKTSTGSTTSNYYNSSCYMSGGKLYSNDSEVALASAIPTSIDGLSGGTLTSALILTGGDGASGVANIQLDTNGQITAEGTTATLFGRTSATTLIVGHSSHSLTLRGSATRPTYNGNNLALYSDMPTFSYNSSTGVLTITSS